MRLDCVANMVTLRCCAVAVTVYRYGDTLLTFAATGLRDRSTPGDFCQGPTGDAGEGRPAAARSNREDAPPRRQPRQGINRLPGAPAWDAMLEARLAPAKAAPTSQLHGIAWENCLREIE
jgi:hypothetical protein